MNKQTLLLIIVLFTCKGLIAQNEANLYGVWKKNNPIKKYIFIEREKEAVDKGIFTLVSEAVPYSNKCNCVSYSNMPFDWITRNGKLLVYFKRSESNFTVEIQSKPGTTSDEKYTAEEACKKQTDKIFRVFSQNFPQTFELPYTISGNQFYFAGEVFTLVTKYEP